jgi:hypothetical protein
MKENLDTPLDERKDLKGYVTIDDLVLSESHSGPCPNCGYCPHCGRSRDTGPYYVPWYPAPHDPYRPWVTWTDTTTNDYDSTTIVYGVSQ